MQRKPKSCLNCEGEGQVLLMCTMFVNDGYRRERCGICGGIGINPDGYKAWSGHLKFIAEAKRRIAEWGGLKPRAA